MVEYGKAMPEYNIGDTVYIYYHEWRKVKIIRFNDLYVKVQDLTSDTGFDRRPTFNVFRSKIAITEDEYKDMQLERKFNVW